MGLVIFVSKLEKLNTLEKKEFCKLFNVLDTILCYTYKCLHVFKIVLPTINIEY